MCLGCFNQLVLRDELHSGGVGPLIGKAAGMPSRRAFMAYSVAAASALSAAGAAAASSAGEGADLILRGGTIRPLAGAPVASALAIKGGKVLAVGDESALIGLRTSETTIVDLAGRTALPGLIDPHCHTLLASLIFELLDDVGYAKYPTRESLVAHLRQEAAATPKGQWIVGSNFDNLLQGGDFTRTELDAISTDHPIFVWYTNGHDACVNSEALEDRRNRRGYRRTAGRRPFRPGRRRQAQRHGLRGKRDAQIRGPLPRQGHARGCGQGGHGFLLACRFRRQHDAARARHDPLGLDRAVRQALEYACLPHQRERDVRRHEGARRPAATSASERARPSPIPCSRSMA